MRLARADRREMVAILAAEEMSSRQIAPVLGANDATIRRDLQGISSGANAPLPDVILSSDGIDRPRPKPKPESVDALTGEVTEAAEEDEP